MAKLQQEMGKLAREIHASLPPEKQGGFTDVYSEFRKGPNSRTLQRYAASLNRKTLNPRLGSRTLQRYAASSACVRRVALSRTAYLSPFLCARARWLQYLERDCRVTLTQHPFIPFMLPSEYHGGWRYTQALGCYRLQAPFMDADAIYVGAQVQGARPQLLPAARPAYTASL